MACLTALSVFQVIQCRVISEGLRKYEEGSARGLCSVTIPAFPYEESQSAQLVSRPRFEPSTSQMQARRVTT
jgi:hypothetical protein